MAFNPHHGHLEPQKPPPLIITDFPFEVSACCQCTDEALCVLFSEEVRLCAGCLEDISIQLYAATNEE